MAGVAAGARHAAAVTFAVAATLTVPLLWPHWTAAALVLAMSALNAAMSHLGPAAVSLTYVTGTLVKFGLGLGRTLCGQPDGWSWLWQAPMWLSLLAAAAATVAAQRLLGADALMALARAGGPVGCRCAGAWAGLTGGGPSRGGVAGAHPPAQAERIE